MLTLPIDGVLKSRFDKLNDTIGKLMLDIKKRDDVVKKLELENRELHDITAKQAKQIETLEGYTRVDNLLVYELPETYAEVGLASSNSTPDSAVSTESSSQLEATFLQFCEMKLKVKINKQDIPFCHRLRKSSSTDTRASSNDCSVQQQKGTIRSTDSEGKPEKLTYLRQRASDEECW